jgi:hypothetical protein
VDSFADFPGASPAYTWSVSASSAYFGYSVESTDAASAFLNNGSACGVGLTNTASVCWSGFSTSPKTINSRASSNDPSGTITTLRLKAEAGSSRQIKAGTYSATLNLITVAL